MNNLSIQETNAMNPVVISKWPNQTEHTYCISIRTCIIITKLCGSTSVIFEVLFTVPEV